MKIEKVFQSKSTTKNNTNHEIELFDGHKKQNKDNKRNKKNKNNINILELNVGTKTNKESGMNFDERI